MSSDGVYVPAVIAACHDGNTLDVLELDAVSTESEITHFVLEEVTFAPCVLVCPRAMKLDFPDLVRTASFHFNVVLGQISHSSIMDISRKSQDIQIRDTLCGDGQIDNNKLVL